MRNTLILAAAFVMFVGCGGSEPKTPTTPQNLDRFASNRLAGEQLCEHAVSNYERNEFLSTTIPASHKELFNRVEYDWRHRDRVRRCQISLSERQAACIAYAPSMQYVQNCDRFAELQ
jgi:hypothetical protein